VSYLAQWVDPTLEVNLRDTVKKIEKEEVDRLLHLFKLAAEAGQISRRLGSDATGEELSIDKKRCRRIAHVATQCIVAWTDKENINLAGGSDVKQEAAVIDWPRWWDEHQVWILQRQRYIATWADKKKDDLDLWCKSAMVKLNNEMLWLSYALRD
jgi:hypothetical protein